MSIFLGVSVTFAVLDVLDTSSAKAIEGLLHTKKARTVEAVRRIFCLNFQLRESVEYLVFAHSSLFVDESEVLLARIDVELGLIYRVLVRGLVLRKLGNLLVQLVNLGFVRCFDSRHSSLSERFRARKLVKDDGESGQNDQKRAENPLERSQKDQDLALAAFFDVRLVRGNGRRTP